MQIYEETAAKKNPWIFTEMNILNLPGCLYQIENLANQIYLFQWRFNLAKKNK